MSHLFHSLHWLVLSAQTAVPQGKKSLVSLAAKASFGCGVSWRFLVLFGLALFVCLLVWLLCVLCYLCILACLSSFTDWCTAHRQQFREQKKNAFLADWAFWAWKAFWSPVMRCIKTERYADSGAGTHDFLQDSGPWYRRWGVVSNKSNNAGGRYRWRFAFILQIGCFSSRWTWDWPFFFLC